ncbi:class E sortase [Streptomyces sp. NBC_01381]|uniref:class E sortase n=1 Tax=Streptomyces sp. NBC_01381 TaxID=2903845 RepID=UPI00225B03B6|nr:class E sortase [Streptomyces sp. NBC_01381]MCX4666995.1 class E sortase [Streptomyces sp. NBC_01381]
MRVPVVVQGRRRTSSVRALWNLAEVAVTLGVVLLLLVAHQLWWTNRQAREGAERQVHALEEEWGRDSQNSRDSRDSRDSAVEQPAPSGGAEDAPASDPDDADPPSPRRQQQAAQAPTPRWDQAYAVLRIPRIGIRVPVAEGVSKSGVLNKGYVGHYGRTAQPGQGGNFALAGHRNTHGEPFRRIDRLRGGDELVVETKGAVYTYVVDKTLAQTSAGDSGVIAPVPRSRLKPGHGYSSPGYYITLTTCTPEYTSKYRLIVWGKLQSMRPR